MVPAAASGTSAHALPARAFWIPILLADLVLLALLPFVGWLALVLALGALAAAAVARVERLLAFLIVGPSLLGLIPFQAEGAGIIFYALRVLVATGLLVIWRRAGVGWPAALGPVLRDRRTLALLAFVAWVWVGLLWTRAPEYGHSKAMGFTLVAPFVFLGAALLWPDRDGERVLDRLIGAGLWVGLLVAAVGVAAALGLDLGSLLGEATDDVMPASPRLGWLGTSPIWLARALSLWLILALWAVARRRLPAALAVAIGVIAVTLMGLTGSRGPLIALLVCPLGLLLLPRGPARGHAVRGRLVPLLAAVAAGLLLVLVAASPEQRGRLGAAVLRVPQSSVLASAGAEGGGAAELSSLIGSDTSTGLRRSLIERARETLVAALPWGLGTGGFAVAFTGEDFRLYPHNVIAEVLVENGLPGALLVLLFLVWVWRGARRLARRGSASARWAWVLFCLALLNAQVSGDLPFNEGIWFWGGLLLALEIAERRCRLSGHACCDS